MLRKNHGRRPATKIEQHHVDFIREHSSTLLQDEIARELRISASTVRRVQKDYGFAHFTRQSGRMLRYVPVAQREARA